MRKSVTVLCLFLSSYLYSQNNLLVQGTPGKLFLSHSAAAKENWYSIGRIYNISPRVIAPFNNLTIEHALSIGEPLKIPLTDLNFSQDNKKAADEVLVPVYHTVQQKEGLMQISRTYNNVPLASIRAWNKLSSDAVSVGANLVVGFLKVKKDLSPLANANYIVPKAPSPKTELENPVVDADNPPVKKEEQPKKTEAKQEVVKKEEVVRKPVEEVVSKPAEKKTEEKQVVTPPAVVEPVKKEVTVKSKPGGYFSDDYSSQTDNGKKVQTSNGNGATFKSTSGWEDAKYYALMNNVAPGTVIRISSQGKHVFAKVLGAMPDIKQNDGLLLRISNAAARELNVGDKFAAEVNWEK